MVFVQDIVFSGNWLVRDCNSLSAVVLEDTIENDCNFYSSDNSAAVSDFLKQ